MVRDAEKYHSYDQNYCDNQNLNPCPYFPGGTQAKKIISIIWSIVYYG